MKTKQSDKSLGQILYESIADRDKKRRDHTSWDELPSDYQEGYAREAKVVEKEVKARVRIKMRSGD